MATYEEIRKEAKWILSNCLIGYTISKIEEGIRRGIQIERERLREQVNIVDGLTHKLMIGDIDIWDD